MEEPAAAFNLTLAERGGLTEDSRASARLDNLLRCTATPKSTCQLQDHLKKVNDLLFYAKLELRELPALCGQLGLVSLEEKYLYMPWGQESIFHQAIALAYQILKTHPCVLHVHIGRDVFSSNGLLICDALKFNRSTRALNIDFRRSVANHNLGDVFCSLKQLEELECLAPGLSDELSSALSTVVRVSTSLMSLKVAELCMTGSTARAFVAGLKENTTLKELSMHGSVIREAGPEEFAQYLRENTSLTKLSVTSDGADSRNSSNWIAEGLLYNKAIKTVNLNNVQFDQENARLTARTFAENRVIRSFNLVLCSPPLFEPSIDYSSWYAPLCNSETLEELSLPMFIWNTAQWVEFFWVASKKDTLKKLSISDLPTANRDMHVLCKVLKESGAEEKVSFGTYFVDSNLDLIYCKAFSDVDLSCSRNIVGELSCALQEFMHITSVQMYIRLGDVALVWAVAACVEAATFLRKLRLIMWSHYDDPIEDINASWTKIVESLSRNTSIKELDVYVLTTSSNSGNGHVPDQHRVERLAQVIKSSRTIRRVSLGAGEPGMVTALLRRLSEEIADNYNLVQVDLYELLDTEAARNYYNVCGTVRRNCGLVTRAAQFARGRTLDRHCAQALERVWRHGGLLEELAEQLSLSVDDTSAIVRRGLRDMEGLHDFMRLARVVRDCVECNPCQDSGPQLDSLNEDCWRLIRRYLRMDDVRQYAESAMLIQLSQGL
ncbi:uncharacterized protein LOC142566745 isoform X1 [Dermacentor variabilis]|uniref:uncharacterized protein LOC142566745 isoform X1 n=1 Tax=Dermacentor variabilis TaxID=34621 RepID=UPI003F5C06D9